MPLETCPNIYILCKFTKIIINYLTEIDMYQTENTQSRQRLWSRRIRVYPVCLTNINIILQYTNKFTKDIDYLNKNDIQHVLHRKHPDQTAPLDPLDQGLLFCLIIVLKIICINEYTDLAKLSIEM